MSKALDTAEQVVVIGLGAGLLYGGYRLFKALGPALTGVSEAAAAAADETRSAAVDVAMADPILQSTIRDIETDDSISAQQAAQQLHDVLR